ncbi:hypothetical protein BDY21DRAFT_21874 [Lineolata rhizophorae]|uniref:RING-type domain-containing protein n=1 Tax=Lineolata rhizophorae TaxID=578093 RepID=A0A6A6P3H7_9PEZI|nr:hypothetical protein BDY21DRAFT_21874 [Lineolata rhizophorae]
MAASARSLLCAVLAMAAVALAQTVSPSNDTSLAPGTTLNRREIVVSVVNRMGAQTPAAWLIPLTGAARTALSGRAQLSGFLHLINDTATDVSDTDISIVPCDGNDAESLIDHTLAANPGPIILMSQQSYYCQYNAANTVNEHPFVYSTAGSGNATELLSKLDPFTQMFTASISRLAVINDTDDDGGAGADRDSSPLGPSPSTAVAMIILYSITGIITALFLVIIVTGAVRAHRHPERYGPTRDAAGRPRQSRARGIARAMLDTIPIVKFGERDADASKPVDVELGSGQSSVRANQTPSRPGSAGGRRSVNGDDDHGTFAQGSQSGTSSGAAVAGSAAAAPEPGSGGEENNPGCTICTDDFEKGQDIRVLPCDHKFHPACIDPWLLNVSGTCPLW